MTDTSMIGHNSAAKPGNWIAISRDIRDHHYVGFGYPASPQVKNKRTYARAEAWLDMLMEAQYRPRQHDVKGATVWVDVGQFLASRTYLAARWNWSQQAVRTFLDRLETEGMIKRDQPTNQQLNHPNNQQKSTKNRLVANIISISNYCKYQSLSDEISVYVDNIKTTNKTIEELAIKTTSQQPASNQPATSQQPESNNVTRKQGALNDSAGAPEEKPKQIIPPSKHNPEKNPDPFGLNPDRHHPDVTRSATGELTLLNGKRSDWLQRFDGDETGLDLALMTIADKVQPNSTRTIEVQVEAQLAGIIQRKREQDQRYLKAASRNARAKTPGAAGGAVMGLEERLKIERERKAGAAQ